MGDIEIKPLALIDRLYGPIHHVHVTKTSEWVLRLWECQILSDEEDHQTVLPGLEAKPISPVEVRHLELAFGNVAALEICDEFLVRSDSRDLREASWPRITGSGWKAEFPFPVVRVVNSAWKRRFDQSDPNFANLEHYLIVSLECSVDVLSEDPPHIRWHYATDIH